jgi:hypothetical protein
MKPRTAIRELRAMLREIQQVHYHEPDSDSHEFCDGCGRSPYNEPPHTTNCIVPRLQQLLRKTARIDYVGRRKGR